MKEQQKKIIEHFVHSYNTFDVQGMIRDLHEDVVFENITSDVVDLRTEGIDAFAKQAEESKHYFSERNQRILSWRFQLETVVVGIDYEAILAIDLPNGMKAGDTLQMKGMSEFAFRGDKIIRIRDIS